MPAGFNHASAIRSKLGLSRGTNLKSHHSDLKSLNTLGTLVSISSRMERCSVPPSSLRTERLAGFEGNFIVVLDLGY